MTTRQDFYGEVHQAIGSVGRNEVHIHVPGGSARPPDGATEVMPCPQCRQLTWQQTQHCWNCHTDVFAARRIAQRQIARVRLFKFAGVLGVAAAVALLISPLFDAPMRYYFAVAGFMFAAGAIKALDDGAKSR